MKICPFCHSEASLLFTTKDYNQRISQKAFDYFQCPSCGLIYLDPIPEDLGEYYPTSYYAVPMTEKQLATKARHDDYKMEILRQNVSQGRLLDIGPSYGAFAWLAKKSGFDVEVIERDADCCRFLNDVVGIKAINSTDIVTALEKVNSYNIITLWQVIEHLDKPTATLEAISKRLLPGGLLIITTPNPASFQFHLLKKYWPHVDAPRHLMLFPAQVIVQKMESLGLKKILFTTKDVGSLRCNAFGWEAFFANMCQFYYTKLALGFIGRIVNLILNPIQYQEGKGSGYMLILQKSQ